MICGLEVKNIVRMLFSIGRGRHFWNYRLMPKCHREVPRNGAFQLKGDGQLALVVQGPIMEESDFTIETLRLYRQNFPDAHIILSTWKVPEITRVRLAEIGARYVENERPTNTGISNVNLQIQTSRNGLLLAKELGAEYAIKTRTDQRLYHPSLSAYLRSLLRAFPLDGAKTAQRERLIGISLGTFKYRLYGLSDMFLFGHIDDVLLYWDIPFDQRQDTAEEREKAGKTWRSTSEWRMSETYICLEFLKKIGRKTKFVLSDSLQTFGERFVIIDSESISLFWNKYTLNADRYSGHNLYNSQISFNDWLMLYSSWDNLNIDQDIFDHPVSSEG